MDVSLRERTEKGIAYAWLRRLENVLATRDPELFHQALHAAGLKRCELEKAEQIDLNQLTAVQLFTRRFHPDITLRLYQAADLSDLGLVGGVVASCATVREAIETVIRYHGLTSDRYGLELFDYGPWAVIRQLPFLSHLNDHQDLAEELCGVCRILEILLGDRVNLSQIKTYFNYSAPAHESAYREVLPGTCIFDAAHTEVMFPRKWLSYRVLNSRKALMVSPATSQQLLGQSDLRTGISILEAAERLLVSRTGRDVPTLEQAAGELQLSVSQMRKRLYKKNTSYKQIVLNVRMTLAKHYLEETSLPVQEIAFLLDYSQAAPFSRAFKSYFGYSPQGSRVA